MKLISWNCNGAFRNKFELLERYKPDIMIIQESESREELARYRIKIPFRQHIWISERSYKGMSIFLRNGWKAEIADFYDEKFQCIVPLIFSRGMVKFLLIAVWTKHIGLHSKSYVVQAFRAMQAYKDYLREDTIIIGDFNSNKIWDNLFRRDQNHSSLIAFLEEMSFFSIYHRQSGEAQGSETVPTIYLYRRRERGYHIDYAFIHNSSFARIKKFSIGKYDEWSASSDHMPVFLEMK